MLNTIQKHSRPTVLQSNTQLETYIFGQVTQKQRHFETFDTGEIYNATFKIVPYSNNSLTEEMFTNIHTHSSKNSL